MQLFAPYLTTWINKGLLFSQDNLSDNLTNADINHEHCPVPERQRQTLHKLTNFTKRTWWHTQGYAQWSGIPNSGLDFKPPAAQGVEGQLQ